jgi:quinol monooxygenase YgiN
MMSQSNVIVKCVEVHVSRENAIKFIEATKKNALHTRKEPGNLRFEIHRSTDAPEVFFFFEA